MIQSCTVMYSHTVLLYSHTVGIRSYGRGSGHVSNTVCRDVSRRLSRQQLPTLQHRQSQRRQAEGENPFQTLTVFPHRTTIREVATISKDLLSKCGTKTCQCRGAGEEQADLNIIRLKVAYIYTVYSIYILVC